MGSVHICITATRTSLTVTTTGVGLVLLWNDAIFITWWISCGLRLPALLEVTDAVSAVVRDEGFGPQGGWIESIPRN